MELTIPQLEKTIMQKWMAVSVERRHDTFLAMAYMRDIDWLLDQLSILYRERSLKCRAG